MSSRPDIRMQPEEVAAFLRTSATAVVVVLDGDGLPSGAVGRLVVEEGADVGFVLGADDRAVQLLAHEGRACCVVEHFPSYYGIQGVMLHGVASRLPERTQGEAAYALTVERVVSYDFGKLPRA
jgi:hypothetical protein